MNEHYFSIIDRCLIFGTKMGFESFYKVEEYEMSNWQNPK